VVEEGDQREGEGQREWASERGGGGEGGTGGAVSEGAVMIDWVRVSPLVTWKIKTRKMCQNKYPRRCVGETVMIEKKICEKKYLRRCVGEGGNDWLGEGLSWKKLVKFRLKYLG